jgi:hypothetical protein
VTESTWCCAFRATERLRSPPFGLDKYRAIAGLFHATVPGLALSVADNAEPHAAVRPYIGGIWSFVKFNDDPE